eukprot:TRINITY_DN394_c0_g1_i2.p1 TRINITY_DN394_c0_g1~~TRINITY_DN394_c0_g1_i2.p1  ORF type:complete len:137 (-),score=44.29 TRINITY_DN394_c0_g1_i2:25-435(-)
MDALRFGENECPTLPNRISHDAMRDGFARTNNVGFVHPVEEIQTTYRAREQQAKDLMLANMYGSHFVMRKKMEEQILGQFRRLPGLTSEFVGLERMRGREEEICFEDYLGDPSVSEKSVDLHVTMERRMGLTYSGF